MKNVRNEKKKKKIIINNKTRIDLFWKFSAQSTNWDAIIILITYAAAFDL